MVQYTPADDLVAFAVLTGVLHVDLGSAHGRVHDHSYDADDILLSSGMRGTFVLGRLDWRSRTRELSTLEMASAAVGCTLRAD